MDKWITSNIINSLSLSSFPKYPKKKAKRMEQMDLIDWLDDKRVIRQLPPSQSTQHRLFIIEQLKLYRTVLAKCKM
ncbi:hypothetical protein BMR04_11825 [Methylococcaceae bacterium HT3]|nr:hypothetical protein BMR04_11825 [Methylococcaceae bacterium HT3]